MRVPLTLIDFLDRAELFGDRTLVVDEPGGPASLGRVSAADLVRRARGMARELDRLGVDHGARVAIVSPNSARFVIALFGVSAFGRVLVPVNFRLNARDVDLHRRALRRRGAPGRPRARRGPRGRGRPAPDRARRRAGRRPDGRLRRAAGALGAATRTRPPRSTTPPAPPPGPRASSSPTAPCGSTPPASAGTWAWASATCTCRRCPSSTATAGGSPTASRRWAGAR